MKRLALVLALAAPIALGAALAGADNGKALPPGLQKKVERGGELPPGWQKKLVVGEILPGDIYAHARVVVPVGDDGIVTVEVEGRVFSLAQETLRIVAILN